MWGPNVWIEVAGHAADDPETLRDTYAAAAQSWVDAGRTAHYVVVPAHDQTMVDAWFRLGFGLQHVHAVRRTPDPAELGPAAGGRDAAPGPARRRAGPRRARPAATGPPGAGRRASRRGTVSSLEEAVAEWEDDLDDDRFATWAAELDGAVVGQCRSPVR